MTQALSPARQPGVARQAFCGRCAFPDMHRCRVDVRLSPPKFFQLDVSSADFRRRGVNSMQDRDQSDADRRVGGTDARPFAFRLRRFQNWFFLGLLYAGFYLCRYNLSVVSPEFTNEFGFNKEQYGYVASGRDFGYAIGCFLNGLFTDGLGGKQAMAVGALGTIVLNLVFAGVSWFGFGNNAMFDSPTGTVVTAALLFFIVTRTVDGYLQSFGAPGMVKINTAWFSRMERGKFAGIFGGMIQLGSWGVTALGGLLVTGFSIALIGLVIPPQNWRSIFIVMPVLLGVILVFAMFAVRNHPEECGHTIKHDDEADNHDHNERLPLSVVFKTIAGNPLAWVNAGAYFATGFVRRALENFWVLYLLQVWSIGKQSNAYLWMAFLLPLSAFIGSFTTGLISDTLAKGRRSPVAAGLYAVETLVLLAALVVLKYTSFASPFVACAFLVAISLTVNSSHSIIGTAVTMDIGGRKMAGFALGLINSFQYTGAILAGFALGGLMDRFGWVAFFWAMLPFSVLGTTLMTGTWLYTRGRDVRGS
ncbi:MAG: MFS transporter [Phycisphaerae bacterium]